MPKMVTVKFIKDYEDQKAGAEIEVPQKVASELVKAGAAEVVPAANAPAAAGADEKPCYQLQGVVLQQRTVNLAEGKHLGLVDVRGDAPGVGIMTVPGVFAKNTRVTITVEESAAEPVK